MFSRKEVRYFADEPEAAAWIINKDDFSVVRKDQPGISQNAKRINAIKDRWYIARGKDRKYFELGNYFKNRGKYTQAEAMFIKTLQMDPQNQNAPGALTAIYKYKEKL
jgi:tetratricopeptide (TPR) repeat protein